MRDFRGHVMDIYTLLKLLLHRLKTNFTTFTLTSLFKG